MNKHTQNCAIRPDALRWAIYLVLLGSSAALAQNGLQPATGPGGTPIINAGHGVPVIDIVAPNAKGLSHNQFLDYNVAKPGLVLNNAVQAGHSQLAGALAGNSQFQGQAASTILNEVISRNASLIEGPQEIFGRPADYILANPNGITLNGGSFINTTRAGFVVGTPEVQEQRLKFVDTLQAGGSLQVLAGGQSNDGGALALIAPRIESQGELRAKDNLDITVGRNQLDTLNGQVLSHLPATPARIDAQLFGAMRAGRIRVVSTAEGAGVRMGPDQVSGRDGINISSAGDLLITGDPNNAASLRSEKGALTLIAADDLTLRAVDGQAKRIDAKAGKQLTLDTTTRESIARDREQWDNKWWFVTTETYDRQRTTTDRKQQGTHLQGDDGITLASGGDMRLSAANIRANGELNLASGGALSIEAGIDSQRIEEQIRHRKHLWRGDSDSNEYKEVSKPSTLSGGRVVAHAAGALKVQGSQLQSQEDTLLYSDTDTLEVKADQAKSTFSNHRSDSKLFGLIASSKQDKREHEQAHGSEVAAQSDLRLASAQQMRIQGSKLKAGQQLQVEAKGDLLIESAQNRVSEQSTQHQRGFTAEAKQTQQAQDGKPASRQYVASIGYQVTGSDHQQQTTQQVGSELQGAGVELQSDAHLQVNGSKVDATAGDLALKAQQTTLGAAFQERDSTTTTTASGGGLAVTAGIDRIGSAFNGHHNQDKLVERDSKVLSSELQATGDISIASTSLVSEAARVNAGKQLRVDATSIDNRAAENREEREQTHNNWQASLGASVEYRDVTRPIERLIEGTEAARFQQASPEDAMAAPSVGADLTLEHLERRESTARAVAQVNELSAGSIAVKTGTLDDQGTAWRATAGALQIDAARHDLHAAADTQTTALERLGYGGDLRIDTSTGEDINVRGAGKGGSLATQQVASTARPGSLYGQQGIQVQLGSDGRYEGTRMDAGLGSLVVTSNGQLTLAQANDRVIQESAQLEGNAWAKGGNRPGSTGGEARGYLKHEQRQSQDAKAQVAQLDAKGDVRLSSKGDLLLEGTRIGSREAKVATVHLESAGVLTVKAASDTHQATGSTLGGGLELAAKQGDVKGGAIGGHLTHGKIDESASQAVDARIETAGKLTARSTAREDTALHLQGLQATAGTVELNASNGGMLVEASANRERRDNLDITAGAGFAQAKGATETQGLHGRVKVEMDKRDNQTWNASNLRAERVDLNSAGDARLEGARVETDHIAGNIGGDLLVASRKDRIDNLSVKVDGRVSREQNPQGYTNALSSLAGPAGGKVTEKAGPALSKAEPSLSPTIKVEVSHQQRDTVAQQAMLRGSEGIDLKVGGAALLVGAKVQSVNGEVGLHAGSLTQQTLNGRDYRRDVTVDASNSPVDLATAMSEIFKGKGAADGDNSLDLGLLRTSGHNRSEQWASSVQDKNQR